jgi:DNA-directed RNA polymerase subunit RPC12/RpoP
MTKYICEQCGKTYKKSPSKQEKTPYYFCSRGCMNRIYAETRGQSKQDMSYQRKLCMMAQIRKEALKR